MTVLLALACGECNGLMHPLFHMDAYECDQGHRITGQEVHAPSPARQPVYEGEGLARTVRWLVRS